MSRSPALVAAAAACACVNFGYRVDLEPAEAGPDAGSEPDAALVDAADCAEAEAVPSADGPQLRLLTLAVDRPVLTVGHGDTVTWTNSDTERHDVVAGAPGAELTPEADGFRSRELGSGERWAWRFCRTRTVFWFCGTHDDQMSGYRIIVQ